MTSLRDYPAYTLPKTADRRVHSQSVKPIYITKSTTKIVKSLDSQGKAIEIRTTDSITERLSKEKQEQGECKQN